MDAETLLVRGVDLPQEPHGRFLAVDLRHDLVPRLDRQHVSQVVVDADRLDPDDARRSAGLELQELALAELLDVVVPDAHFERLRPGHDVAEVRVLDAQLPHSCSFLVEVETPLLNDAVRCVPAREHTFERPAVTLQTGDLPWLWNQVDIQLVAVVHQEPL